MLHRYADRSTISYTFDANGNLTWLIESGGTTTFEDDALNHMTKKTLPGGSTISYTYDGVGNLTSLTDAAGVVGQAYDPVNRLQTLTEPGNKLTQFGYDNNDRRTSTAYPNGVTMTTTYDNAGRITKIEGKTATGTTLTSFSYRYVDPTSGADTELSQGVVDKDGNTISYSIDALNRLLQAQTKNSGGTVTATYQYQYDAVSNILSKTVNGTTTSYTYNGANEITTTGFTLDANGNMTAEASGLQLSYNAKNQTASYTLPGSKKAVSMSYTGASQVQRIGVGSTSFKYSSLGLGLETSAAGTTANTRDQAGTLIGERLPAGNYYYLYDGLGNTVALTDSSGAVVNTYAYEPYGKVTTTTGTEANPTSSAGPTGPTPTVTATWSRSTSATTTRAWGAGRSRTPWEASTSTRVAIRSTPSIRLVRSRLLSTFRTSTLRLSLS